MIICWLLLRHLPTRRPGVTPHMFTGSELLGATSEPRTEPVRRNGTGVGAITGHARSNPRQHNWALASKPNDTRNTTRLSQKSGKRPIARK